MTHTAQRLLGAVALLAATWVLVYWLWQPGPPPIRFADEQPGPGRQPPTAVEPAPARSPPATPALPTRLAIRDPLQSEPLEQPPARVQPGGAATPPRAPAFREYTIRDDDTFEAIALRELGSRGRVSEILAANPDRDPRRLRAGDVIRIPAGTSDAPPPAAPIAASPTPAAAPATAPPAPTQTYTVRRSDTLSEISQRVYGTSRLAQLIFEANRDQLASIDAVREGQVLRIPPRPE
ncbi:MAG: LysM peptidoglycan-binding domain-containing protein [Phycisphaerales bacterium]